jgi:hypothetical protein
LQEESAANLSELFFDPHAALTRLAPDFKRVEGTMEASFWSSRYAGP